MTELVNQVIQLISQYPSLAGAIVFFCSIAEAIIVVGTLFPGTVIVLAIAGFAGAAQTGVWTLVLWAAAGAVVGDGVSFWIGHRYGDRLRRMRPFAKRPELLERGTAFFERHGGKSVFLGRFVPGVKATVPAVAGLLGMAPARFYSANVISAVLWAGLHVLPAAGVGLAVATLGAVSGRLVVLMTIVSLLALLSLWGARVFVVRLAPVAAGAYRGAVDALGRRDDPASKAAARILDPARPRALALALWGSILLAAGLGFLSVVEDLLAGDPLVRADVAINRFVQSLRTPFGDAVMVVITSLGDTIVIGAVAVAVVSCLLWYRAKRAAAGFALTLGFATVFVTVVKAIVEKPRPIPLYSGADAFSFPSGHATLATVLYGLVAVLVARALSRQARIMTYCAAGTLAGIIGFSRIYLSAHWPSDVIGGLLFGIAMTSAFALVFEHLPTPRAASLRIGLVALSTLAIVGTWHATTGFDRSLSFYARQSVIEAMRLSAWTAGGWRKVPAARIDLAGEIEEPFAVQWLGATAPLEKALQAAGWTRARPWSAATIARLANPSAKLADFPPLPLMHDGRLPALTMTRPRSARDDSRLVLRFWPSRVAVTDQAGEKRRILPGSLTVETARHPFGLATTLKDDAASGATTAMFFARLRTATTIRVVPVDGLFLALAKRTPP